MSDNAEAAAVPAPPATPEVTVSLYEKRKKIQVKRVRGFFDNWRIALVIVTQLIFYGGPWLQWNDRQALLFHLVERKFYLFGLILWPQDVIYLAVLLIISAYGLFLVTAIAGRLFCGYACPQTVYTEVFMWIEHWVEGDRNARLKLDKEPMSGRKLRIRATKFALWGLLALWTGFTLTGYFTPMSELLDEAKSFAFGPWETFWIFFYAGFTFLMAGFMREQVCKYMCPYARFQSAMFDQDTLIITYDAARGEPRGPRSRKAVRAEIPLGDCVNCGLCVDVCPTGIDIREGLQYECIGCAACIDACDEVMDKFGYPRGLIRYSTENALAHGWDARKMVRRVLRARTLVYGAILFAVCAALAGALALRVPLKVDIVRDRASLAREVEGGRIENVYRIQVMNTQERAHRYRIGASGLPGIAVASDAQIEVPAATTRQVPLRIQIDPGTTAKGSHRIEVEVQSLDDAGVVAREQSVFLVR